MEDNKQITFRKKIIHTIAFAVMLVLVLGVISQVLIYAGNTRSVVGNFNSHGIFAEKDHTIDVVAIGNSNYYSGLAANQMWEEHGITAYVWGEASQRIYETRHNLKKIFKHQSPKVVFLEPSCIFREKSTADNLSQKMKSNAAALFPVFTYHSRWRLLFPNRWNDWTTDMKCVGHGSKARLAVHGYKEKDWMKENKEKAEVNPLARRELEKCIQICKENGAIPVILAVPGPHDWDMKRYNTVKEIADAQGVELLDMNHHLEELKLDWKKDTPDGGYHLNYWGARKVTAFLGNYLAETQKLKDHRGDGAYRQWEEDCKIYDEALQQRLNRKKAVKGSGSF